MESNVVQKTAERPRWERGLSGFEVLSLCLGPLGMWRLYGVWLLCRLAFVIRFVLGFRQIRSDTCSDLCSIDMGKLMTTCLASLDNTRKLKHLVTPSCPFMNLPETKRSRFGEELNAEKMKKAVWLRPEAVAQIEFLEWTEAVRLRHSKFVGLREDKNPRSVVKEQAGEP